MFKQESIEDILQKNNFTEILSTFQNVSTDYYTKRYMALLSDTIFPIQATIGSFLNFSAFALLVSLRMNTRVYNYLILKFFFQGILSTCLIFMGDSACMSCLANWVNYQYVLWYKIYVIQWAVDSVTLMIGLTEILLTFDRFYLLRGAKKSSARYQLKYIVMGVIFFSIILHIFTIRVFKIEHVTENIYQRSWSEFGNSFLFEIYYFGVLNVVKLSLLILYLVLVILVVIYYRKFIVNKKKLRNSISEKARNDNNITKMIISFGVLYFFASIFVVMSHAIALFEELEKSYNSILIIIRLTGYFVSIGNLSLSALVIVCNDININKKLRQIFLNEKK